MSNECKCLKPESTTRCPVQHVAICIKGKNRQCQGECVPIPEGYRETSDSFNDWLSEKVDELVREYAFKDEKTSLYFDLERKAGSDDRQARTVMFQAENIGEIQVRYAYEFYRDDMNQQEEQLVFEVS